MKFNLFNINEKVDTKLMIYRFGKNKKQPNKKLSGC